MTKTGMPFQLGIAIKKVPPVPAAKNPVFPLITLIWGGLLFRN
jgi:hypothetical protein